MAPSVRSKYPNARGFMLIEVLVALFIIALLMAALIKSTTDNTRNMIILKNKTIGSWVASNIVANIELGLISPTTSAEQSVKIPMLGQIWDGAVNFQNTTQKNIWRVDIDVQPTSFAKQSVLHVVTYFSPAMIAKPQINSIDNKDKDNKDKDNKDKK